MDAFMKYQRWLSSGTLPETEKEELRGLPEAEIQERFYKDLEFGTGGLRGIMGLGTNRMNIYTVRRATQGLAEELLADSASNAEKGVVIAYDSRNNSAKFAYEAARVLCGNNVRTYMFDSLRPTPELSFAVRHLGCCRGIVITASHNPKEYNGYKVYGGDGGQVLPAHANEILKRISSVDIFEDVRIASDPQINVIGKAVDDAYIAAVKNEAVGCTIPDDFHVLYTPLHGSGYVPVMRILKEIGVKDIVVPMQQQEPDGDFPTVKSPNPEEGAAFELAIAYADKLGNIDLILGTDPDSDRVGVVVKNREDRYITLNGNQTAVILCDFILRNLSKKGMPRHPKIIKTIVTTQMVAAIADRYAVETENVLTGFKYIGDTIRQFESTGDNFLFGCEESYGYLKGTYARDKDAVVASMLICEAAAECKADGITLYDRLQRLYKEYGFFTEKLVSYTFAGMEGMQTIRRIMDGLYSLKTDSETKRICSRDGSGQISVIQFVRDNGTLTARPSGTEPKIKFYCAVKAESAQEAERLIAEQTAFVQKQVSAYAP